MTVTVTVTVPCRMLSSYVYHTYICIYTVHMHGFLVACQLLRIIFLLVQSMTGQIIQILIMILLFGLVQFNNNIRTCTVDDWSNNSNTNNNTQDFRKNITPKNNHLNVTLACTYIYMSAHVCACVHTCAHILYACTLPGFLHALSLCPR